MDRYPLRSRTVAIALVELVVAVLLHLGLDASEVDAWVAIVTQGINVAVMLGLLVVVTEPKVTPVADPYDDDGNRLVPQVTPGDDG